MSLIRAMFSEVATTSDPNSWIVRAAGGGKTYAGTYVSEYTALNLPVVYRAVSLIADSLAYLPLDIYQRTGAQKKEIADQRDDYWLIHSTPNENMTSFVWRQTVQGHSLLWGNGYSWIRRNGRGVASEILPLLPDRTRPVKDPGKDLYYESNVDGERLRVNPADVLHVPALGFDGLVGYSPIYMHRQAVGMALALEEFGGKFFSNDAKSGGFIHYPGKLSEKAEKNLRESVERQGSLDNAHRVKVLEEGAKFVTTTIPPEDAQFLGTREFQIAEVARMYGVPLHMLQSHEKVTSWGSGIEEMTLGFILFTLATWLVRWEQELNRKLFLPSEQRNYFVKFNINALLRGNANSRADFYQKAINSGWMEPNEAREKEDMNPLPEKPKPVEVVGAQQPPQPQPEEDSEE